MINHFKVANVIETLFSYAGKLLNETSLTTDEKATTCALSALMLEVFARLFMDSSLTDEERRERAFKEINRILWVDMRKKYKKEVINVTN